MVLVGVIIVLVPLFYGLYRYYYGYTHYGPVAASFWSQSWYLTALLGLVVFGAFTLNVIKKSRHRIAVHQYGICLKTGRSMIIAWERIQGVSFIRIQPNLLNLFFKPRTQAHLFLDDGKIVRLDQNFEGFNDLLTRIKSTLYPKLLDNLKSSYNSGEWVNFGSLAIQQNSLRINNREILWSDIDRLYVKSGYLVVELANRKQIQAPVINIPNLELLLKIVQAGVSV